MNEKILSWIFWSLYAFIAGFMILYPFLIGGLVPVVFCTTPISGDIWLYLQGSLQIVVYGFFFPFCFDTYMYYCTETQNTIPGWLFKTSLIGTAIGEILSVVWGILGIYLYARCEHISLISQSMIGLGIIDIILYILGSIIIIFLIVLDFND